MTTEEIELVAPPDAAFARDDELAPGDPGPEPPEQASAPQWRKRVAIGLAGLIVFVICWVLVAIAVLTSGIERIAADDLPSLDASGTGPVNYLLVGTDSREGLSEDLGPFFGDFGGERADVIMLLHAEQGRLQMLSLPRDLRVSIPGHGSDRVNAAYAYGGPDLLVQTVRELTGLPVHHYLEVRFSEFARAVDAIGGVTIDFPYPSRDLKSGLDVEAGIQQLDGAQAVAYVRSRSLEEFRDGAWIMHDPGDIARTGRQQQVIDQLLGSVTRPTRFPVLPFMSRGLGASLRADEGLSIRTLATLGWAVTTADATETTTLPTRHAPSGGVFYLEAVQPAADDLLARFGKGDPLSPEG